MFGLRRTRLMMSLLTFVLIAMIFIVSLYAYFQISEEHGITIASGEFDVELLVSFNDVVVDIESDYYDVDKKKVVINMYDETAVNYIDHMKIDLKVTPVVTARMRFKIQMETDLIRYYIDQSPENPIPPLEEVVYHNDLGAGYYPFSPIRFDTNFNVLDNDDGYLYYDGLVYKDLEVIIPIIDGGLPYTVRSNSVLYETCFMYLDMDLDIVQANRFAEVWGIDQTFFS